MIEKNDILNAVKHIVRHNASPQKLKIMHPTREWFVILCMAVLGVVAAALYSYTMYTWYDLRDDVTVTTETPTVPYREALVEAALTQYRTLESAYTSRVTALGTSTPTPVVDVVNMEVEDLAESELEVSATTTESTTPSTEDASATTTEIAPGSIELQI